jgi:hypothetical protein
MPFNKPYQTEFKQNDLIYGLGNIREYYIDNYSNFESALNDDITVFIDEYDITPCERVKLQRDFSANEYLFFNTLKQHSKYNTVCTESPFKFNFKKSNKGSFTIEKPDSIHRKCKGGLYWASESYKNGKGFSIHFLLDGIDMEKLALKSTDTDMIFNLRDYVSHRFLKDNINLEIDEINFTNHSNDILVKDRSVTGVELRWIYRNRKAPCVQKAIQFWYEGKPCCPPWDKNFDFICDKAVSHLWLLYRPRSHEFIRRQRIEIIFERLCKLAAM